MTKRKELVFEVSSGNVFADLGLPNAEELGTKVRLAASLNAILARRKMTQAEAARVLGVNQPKVSALKGYKLEGFSVERLMHFVTALEHDVVIEIRPRAEKKKGAGRVRVVGAAQGEGLGSEVGAHSCAMRMNGAPEMVSWVARSVRLLLSDVVSGRVERPRPDF